MKKIKYIFVLITSLSISYAQAQTTDLSIDELRVMEAKQHQALEGFVASGAGADIDVTYHRFEWQIDPAVRYIKGAVTTYFKLTKPLGNLSFDLDDVLKVDSVKFHGVKLTYSQANKILSINPPNTAIAAFDSITVFYQGVPPTTGFGSFEQRIRNAGTAIAAAELWTLSEPYGSRDWFPGKMDLFDKIDSIDVIVTTPPQYKVASNGLLINESVNGSQSKTYHWKHRYPIANYLVAIAVTNYQEFSDKIALSRGDSLYVLNYAYPEEITANAANARKVLPIIRYFDSLVGDYPFKREKYGQARFGWGGGQEHQTFTFLVNYSTSLMAHELAHQWFGDKITCGSWQDIWLNESFATFMTGVYTEKLESSNWQNWKVSTINSATRSGNGSVFVDDTTTVNRIFSGQLSYDKGAYVLRMLQWKMGTENFYKAIRNYLTDPSVAYGFARTNDLKKHLEQISGQNLTEFFNDWFYGQGYPTYNIDYYPSDVSGLYSFAITQTQSHPSVSFFEMPIPLRVKFENGKDTTVVIDNTLYFGSKRQQIEIYFRNGSRIMSIEFDPELWLLSKGNTVNLKPTPTQEVDNQKVIHIYPNPTTDNLSIDLKNDKAEILTFDIINALGESVYREKQTLAVGENLLNIALPTTLSKGFYALKISSGSWITVKKFMKM
jgi:aminopeptidase N